MQSRIKPHRLFYFERAGGLALDAAFADLEAGAFFALARTALAMFYFLLVMAGYAPARVSDP